MRRYVKNIAAGLVIGLLAVALRIGTGFGIPQSIKDVYLLISDAFFVSGIILVGFGGLFYASGQGMFDLFYYTLSKKLLRDNVSYGDFRDIRHQTKKDPVPTLITGTGLLTVSVIFCVLCLV